MTRRSPLGAGPRTACDGPGSAGRMPRASILILLAAALALLALPFADARGDSGQGEAKEPPESRKPPQAEAAPDSSAASSRIIAYYFHATRRCASCRKLEAYTAEAIEAGFREELKAGRLLFLPVNVEEEGNEHFVRDYQLFTKQVVLVQEKDGAQVRWKNLPKVWQLLGDKKKFVEYVREETRTYLEGKS